MKRSRSSESTAPLRSFVAVRSRDQRPRGVPGRELLRPQGRSRHLVAPAPRRLGVLVRPDGSRAPWPNHARTWLQRIPVCDPEVPPDRAREVPARPRQRHEEPVADAPEERGRLQLRPRLPVHRRARGDGHDASTRLRAEGARGYSDDDRASARDPAKASGGKANSDDGSSNAPPLARRAPPSPA